MKLNRYISPEYCESQKELHRRPKGYGGRGDKWAHAVYGLHLQYGCRTILDYGCGRGKLAKALKVKLAIDAEVFEYDPAVEGKDWLAKGKTFDLVVCTDVLEHIEPERLGVVIEHLFSLANKAVFLVIATRPSNKFFEAGPFKDRNVHLIIEPDSWWKERIKHPDFVHEVAPKSPMDMPSRELVALLVRQ